MNIKIYKLQDKSLIYRLKITTTGFQITRVISISVHLKELGKPTKGKNANKNQGKSLEKDVK